MTSRKFLPQSSWFIVFVAYVSVVVLYINIFSIPPIILSLIRDTGINHFQAGLLMTVYTAIYCVSNIVTGILSDRFGPKKIMMGGLLISFLSSLIFTYTSNFNIMLITRATTGIGAASMTSPCIVYILSWLPSKKASLGVSGHLASLTLGSGIVFLITPIIIEIYPWRLLLRLYAILGFMILILFYILSKGYREKNYVTSSSIIDKKDTISKSPIILLSAILFITLFQIGGTMTWLTPWLEERCTLSSIKVGLGSMTFALAGVPSSIFGGYISSNYASSKIQNILYLSMVGMLISVSTGAFVWLESNKYFFFIFVVILLSRWGSFMSVGPLLSIVSRLVKKNSKGFAIGLVNSIAMSGGFLSSLLGGYIIEHTGEYRLLWITFSVLLIFSTLVLHPLLGKELKNYSGPTELSQE